MSTRLPLVDRHFYKKSCLFIANQSQFDVKVYVCRRDEEEGLPKVRIEDGSQKVSGELNVPQGGGGGLAHESAFHVEYERSRTKYPLPFQLFYLNAASGTVYMSKNCSIDKGIACRVIISRGLDEEACIVGLRAGDLSDIIITDNFFPNSASLGQSCMPGPPSTRPRITHPTSLIDTSIATGGSTEDRSSTSSLQPPLGPERVSRVEPASPPSRSGVGCPTATPESSVHEEVSPPRAADPPTVPPREAAIEGDRPSVLLELEESADKNGEPLRSDETAATEPYHEQSARVADRNLGSRTSSTGELTLIETIIEKVSDAFKISAAISEPNLSVNLTANQDGKTFAATLSRSTSTPAFSIPSTPSSETRPPSSLSNSSRPSGATSPHNPVREAHPQRPESTPVPSLRVVPPSRTLSWSSGLTSAADTPSTYHPHNGSFAHRTPRNASSTPSTSPMYYSEAVTPPPRHYRTQGTLSPCRASLDADEDPMKGYTPTAAYMKTGGHRNVSKKLF